MPDPVAPPRDSYFVIVTGAMNPAIHHPYWYRAIGAINEAELQASLKIPFGGTTPFASQLQFGSRPITVNCQAGQWLVQSTDAGLWERMLDITSIVFKKLNETPVTDYGLMTQRHIDTNAPDVKAVMAKRLTEVNLGLPAGKSTGSNVILTVIEEDCEVTAGIQPSVLSERAVFGFYNRRYHAPNVPVGYFDVGALLTGRFEQFIGGSEKFFTDIVTAVNSYISEEQIRE